MTYQEAKPFVVRIVQEEHHPLDALADVLLGSIGLTGVIALCAVLLGAVVGSLMFWIRSRSA